MRMRSWPLLFSNKIGIPKISAKRSRKCAVPFFFSVTLLYPVYKTGTLSMYMFIIGTYCWSNLQIVAKASLTNIIIGNYYIGDQGGTRMNYFQLAFHGHVNLTMMSLSGSYRMFQSLL